MQRSVLCFAMLFFLAAFCCDTCCAQQQVSIATMNCEFLVLRRIHVKYRLAFDLREERTLTDQQREQWNDNAFRTDKLKLAAKAVAAGIKQVDASVMVLTEVGNASDFKILTDALKEAGVVYPHAALCKSADTITGQHVAVLSRFPLSGFQPKLPGRETYLREPDDTETEDDTSISKGMKVTVTAGGHKIHLYCIHLTSERGGHEKDEQRIAQASIVRRNYLPSLQRGEIVVVAGDVNEFRGQPTLRRLRGLDDIQADLIQPAGPARNSMRKGETGDEYNQRIGNHYTFVFGGRRQQIDHILYSHSLRDVSSPGSMGVRFLTINAKIDGFDIPATDHRAMVLDFRLK